MGRDVRYFDYSYYGSGIPGDEETVAFAENALAVMESLGATIVDTDTGDVFAYTGDEFTALLFEFKTQIAQYLQTLSHTSLRTLADLIAFDNAHCVQELVYYGQEIFELAEMQGDLSDPTYIAARSHATAAARAGIDGAIDQFYRTRCGRLSEFFDACRHSILRQTCGHADVQHLLGRTPVARNGLRS